MKGDYRSTPLAVRCRIYLTGTGRDYVVLCGEMRFGVPDYKTGCALVRALRASEEIRALVT